MTGYSTEAKAGERRGSRYATGRSEVRDTKSGPITFVEVVCQGPVCTRRSEFRVDWIRQYAWEANRAKSCMSCARSIALAGKKRGPNQAAAGYPTMVDDEPDDIETRMDRVEMPDEADPATGRRTSRKVEAEVVRANADQIEADAKAMQAEVDSLTLAAARMRTYANALDDLNVIDSSIADALGGEG